MKQKSLSFYEILTKHSTQSEHHVGFLDVKPGGT